MTFSFVQITDHHLGETESQLMKGYSTAHAVRKVLRHIAENVGERIDFLITTGDQVNDASEVSYSNFCQMFQLQAVSAAPGPALVTLEGLQAFPMYFLPGNHDDRELFFRYLFADTPSMPLMNVSFQHKGVQFICLDFGAGDDAVAYPETLDYLERSLQAGFPSVILTHHHMVPMGNRWQDDYFLDKEKSEIFWNIATQYQAQILGVLSGHVHTTYEKVKRGIPVFGLRSTAPQVVFLDEPFFCLQPLHYRLVTVQDGILTTRIFEVPL
ncbi:metallophosphoesterase family protein [Ktedonobacter robiniae]|uniref:3',5'-cyclic adenosine monophosphate phosphodiesterase CpdA n=1 Tax=Ktedonobacter robiniae TaxID=2778365 RepID=A0ABQ3UVX4_9CHLR|nr:metallophosphoesterase [Ktedonobacter robiniae]GHO56747.1 3',5'-cyclic adenosine monophosphate phosphodiesterase CpdA [Ktedonobacter robiniae]